MDDHLTCFMYRILPNIWIHDKWINISQYHKMQVIKYFNSPPDKTAAILRDDVSKCIFVNKNYSIPIQIPLKFVLSCQIDNKPALFQVMAWRRMGDKPLPEPMVTNIIDIYADDLCVRDTNNDTNRQCTNPISDSWSEISAIWFWKKAHGIS